MIVSIPAASNCHCSAFLVLPNVCYLVDQIRFVSPGDIHCRGDRDIWMGIDVPVGCHESSSPPSETKQILMKHTHISQIYRVAEHECSRLAFSLVSNTRL